MIRSTSDDRSLVIYRIQQMSFYVSVCTVHLAFHGLHHTVDVVVWVDVLINVVC